MPGVSNDPITPYITFLALFRAVAAVIYSLIFIIYFRSSQVKSMHFAMLWLKVLSLLSLNQLVSNGRGSTGSASNGESCFLYTMDHAGASYRRICMVRTSISILHPLLSY